MVHIITYIDLIALFFLMLITGVFWGLYISLSRSYQLFTIDELAKVGRIIVNNLEIVMRNISMACLVCMILSTVLFSYKNELGFYLKLLSIVFVIIALMITVVVELPINNKIINWSTSTAPGDWETYRNRWQYFNLLRTISALISFILFSISIIVYKT